MKMFRKAIPLAALMSVAGCAAPRYDVAYNNNGQPTVSSIVAHTECELTNLVRDKLPPPGSGHFKNGDELDLLDGDYDVQATLELEVNDTGGLTPSVTFMEPISKVISFSLGGSATLSESRDQHFTDNFQLSMRQLYAKAQNTPSTTNCAPDDSNLGKTLGIDNFVAMGFEASRLPAPVTPSSAPPQQMPQQKGGTISTATEAFGGVITFIVTKNISAFGPTWITTRWKGPGGLIGLSEVNTDKITLAFAEGPNAGHLMPTDLTKVVANGPNLGAYGFNQQQLNQTISTQLQMLQSQLSQ